jgi:hypothetical protein
MQPKCERGIEMTRKLRIVGLTLTMALTIGALGASMARAEMTFTGFEGLATHVPTLFRAFPNATGIYEFRSTPGSWVLDCNETKFTAPSETGKNKTLTASVSNTTCGYGPAKQKSHLQMNSCDYRYNLTKKIDEHKYEGTTDVQCTKKGDAIDIQVTKAGEVTQCTIKIEEQSGIGPIYYENITPMMGLKFVWITHKATNIKTITEAPSGMAGDCGVTKLGTHATGSLSFEMALTGLNKEPEENEVNVTISG